MGIYKKIAIKVLMIMNLILLVGCSTTAVSNNQVYEQTIELSMPDEDGIFIEKIGDGSMILVKLNSDYRFKEYLEKGSSSMDEHVEYLKSSGIDFYDKAFELPGPFCTTYSAQYEEGNYIMGRNDDLYPDDTAILLYTKPADGYASVSMTDGVYFGYENENTDVESVKKYMAAVAHFPADGMNEYGVAIAQNSVTANSSIDPEKISIGSLQAVRLVLDYAKDVEEALELLDSYNIYFELDEQCHYMISDATGRSVIVEFVDGNMVVLENDDPWQVNTNFVVSQYVDEEDAAYRELCLRYQEAHRTLKEKNGILKNDEPMELLKKTVQSFTLYSTVYNKTTGDIQVAMRRKFSKIYQFKLEMK